MVLFTGEELAAIGIALLAYVAGLGHGLMIDRTPKSGEASCDITEVKSFTIMAQGHHVCPECGGKIHGDGVTSVRHCEHAELEHYVDLEPDAGIVLCPLMR